MTSSSTDLSQLVSSEPRPGRTNLELANPKFQLKGESADTGLEAMFDSVFSIRDEPAEVRVARQERGDLVGEEKDSWKVVMRSSAVLVILGVAVGLKALAHRGAFEGDTGAQEGLVGSADL